jgi:hypothetical protein
LAIGCGAAVSANARPRSGSDVLADLNESDLGQLGVTLGDRKHLMKAIASRDAPVVAPAGTTPIPPAADSAERRQLTVMFCDLVGSTAMPARLNPEDMRQIICSYQDAVSGVVARYDGIVAEFMGDDRAQPGRDTHRAPVELNWRELLRVLRRGGRRLRSDAGQHDQRRDE